MTARTKKILSYVLKFGILVLAAWYIYHRILKNTSNIHDFERRVAHISSTKVAIIMICVVLLMVVNWVLESLKWRHLTRILSPMSVWKAIEAVFCGLTWAIFTPNRIGEYGGRVMFLPNRKRIHGVFAMAVGSFGQLVVTNVLGAGATVWFLYSFLHLNSWLMAGITLVAAGFIAVMLVFYFHIKWLVWLLNRVKLLKKYHRFFDIMGNYKTADLLKIMWFCIARFCTFTFQYYLIIHLLVPEIPLVEISLIMFVFFFIQSAIPSLDLIDFGVRNFTANMLFSYVTNQQIAIVVAVSLIIIINLIIPAVLGSIFVFKLKFFDRNS